MQYSSETVAKLAEALAKAQGEMKNAPLNKVNPHFKSKYADLAAIRDAVTGPLAKHGIAVTQMTGTDDNGQFVLWTRLSHSSGEWLASAYPLHLGKPQEMGSALTYARRYTLAAMAGLAADEDDDANAAQDQNGKQPQAPARTYSGKAQRGQTETQSQGAESADQSKKIEVVDADGEIEAYPGTKRGAMQALGAVEKMLGNVSTEDGARLWEANADTFHKLAAAERIGAMKESEGAQSFADRVHALNQAFREYLNNAA